MSVTVLTDGDNPATCYCRICGQLALPPYDGYYAVGVCSTPCFEEYQWRDVLRMLRKSYTRRKAP